jgi:hypothetical protein
MAIDLCNPCCNPNEAAKSQDAFRSAELTILCNILGVLSGGTTSKVQVDVESGELAGAAFTVGWQTVLTPSKDLVALHFHTSLSQDVALRINGGTPFKLLSSIGAVTFDLGEKGKMNAGLVEAAAYNATAITGMLVVWGY